MCFYVNTVVHLAAGRADAELRVVGLGFFVQDVMSSNLLLQVCHGRPVFLRAQLFLSANTRQILFVVCGNK